MIKHFSYDIDHSNVFRKIKIDVNECQTLSELIKKISEKSTISSELKCINEPNKQLLRDIKEYYKFQFVTNNDDDLKSCLISLYKKEKNVYFSQCCIKNNLKIVNKDTKPRFDFIGEIVEIKLGEYIKFYLSNDEKSINACELIQKELDCDSIRIKGEYDFLENNEKLKNSIEYEVFAYYQVKFQEKGRSDQFCLKMEFRSTVLDAKNELANNYNKSKKLSVDNIIILNGNNAQENSKKLRTIHRSLHHIIEFKIDYTKEPVERNNHDDSYDNSFDSKIEVGKPFEIRNKSNRKRIPNNRFEVEESGDKNKEKQNKKPQKRSDSVCNHQKPQPKQDSDHEVSESEPKPKKKVNTRKFKPSYKPAPQEEQVKIVKKNNKRAESVKRTTKHKIEEKENKIKILFEFDEFEGNKHYKYFKAIEKEKKIKEVADEFKNKFNLDYIKFKYKNGKYIVQNKVIKDIEDEIRDDKKPDLLKIYVETVEKRSYDDEDEPASPKAKKKQNKIKAKTYDDDEPASPKTKTKQNKIKAKAYVVDDDDDDDEPPPRKIKNKEKGNRKKSDGTDQYDILSTEPKQNKKTKKTDKKVDDDDDDDDDYDVPPPKKNKKVKKESKSKSKKITYNYQINGDDETLQIKLSQDATVLTMKQKIAKENQIENLASIRIIFAGKELLDELELEPLQIDDMPLFVNIRFEEEVLLLTAKALRNSK